MLSYSRYSATKRGFWTYLTYTMLILMLAAMAQSSQSPRQAGSNIRLRKALVGDLRLSVTLPPATVGVSYNAVISVIGGKAPYGFQAQNLAAGLTLASQTGTISGTPTTAGESVFSVWVTDVAGRTGLGRYVLTISAPAIVVTVSPVTATVNSGETAQFHAQVSNASNTGITWSTSKGTVSNSGVFIAPTVIADTSALLTATSVADPTQSASASVSIVAPVPKVSLQVLFPPMHLRQPYSGDVRTYLMNNPAVSGAILPLQWSAVDSGSAANPQYDWSHIDGEVAEWIAAGKKVHLVIWAVSDTPTNSALPQYVWDNLGSANQTTCSGQQIPNYFSPAFQVPYQQFMAQVVQHYGQNPGIGYIRFGLGRGGETNPARGLGTEAICTDAFTSWGWTEAVWINYLNSMLTYEASLNAPKQLMVGLVGTNMIRSAPHAVAATAVPMHIGIGSQGLAASDITNYPNCTSHWCDLFDQYLGQVPLELQPVEQSDPSGGGLTGSLVPLIPFAIERHAQILEIFWQDWLLAFDPAYPGNDQYGAAYAQVLTEAANTPTK